MFRTISRCATGCQALLWAVALLSTSWVLRGTCEADTVFVILTGLAGGSVAVGSSGGRRGRAADSD